jgi:hypothetical protein
LALSQPPPEFIEIATNSPVTITPGNIAPTAENAADWLAGGLRHGTPAEFSDFVQAETVKFASIIEKEGLQMEVK